MRFNKLDLNLLVALDALLKERSISRAAERLHLSQSATSNALARLREYFDDQLLVQVGRKMEPTPRADVDAIFLFARNAQARLLLPQLKSFEATRFPILATSAIYGGANSAADIDLESLGTHRIGEPGHVVAFGVRWV